MSQRNTKSPDGDAEREDEIQYGPAGMTKDEMEEK